MDHTAGATQSSSLDVTALPSSIRRAWDAVVPPLVELLAMWLACAYLIGLPNTTRVISEWSSQAAILPSENIRAAISFYGLATLVPLAVIVCVFLLAHVVGQFARLVGNILPGYLIQNTTLALYQALKPWYLRRLWVCYPELTGANGLNTLDLLIDEAMERAAVDPNGHYLLKARYFTKTRLNRFRDRA